MERQPNQSWKGDIRSRRSYHQGGGPPRGGGRFENDNKRRRMQDYGQNRGKGRGNRQGGRNSFPNDFRRGSVHTYPVLTNYFQLNKLVPYIEIFEYHVTAMKRAKKVFSVDANGAKIRDENSNNFLFKFEALVPGEGELKNKYDIDLITKSDLWRRVLLKWKNSFPLSVPERIAIDGSRLIFSVGRLFNDEDSKPIASQDETQASYAKEDTVALRNATSSDPPRPRCFFVVLREEDGNARPSYFQVKISETGRVAGDDKWKQFLNVLIKSRPLDNPRLDAPGSCPRTFFCTDYNWRDLEVLGATFREGILNDSRGRRGFNFDMYALLVGLLKGGVIAEGGNFFEIATLKIKSYFREFKPSSRTNVRSDSVHDTSKRIPVLQVSDRDPRYGSIAGVEVRLDHELSQEKLKEVEAALREKGMFHVEYSREICNQEIRESLLKRASLYKWNQKELEAKLKGFQKCKRVTSDRELDGNRALWPTSRHHVFEPRGSDEPITVERYFSERCPLKYPLMPLVHLENGNRIPVEFLYQVLAPKKNANALQDTLASLRIFDENGGDKYMETTTALIKKVDIREDDDDAQSHTAYSNSQCGYEIFGLTRSSDPFEVKATVLVEPTIQAGGSRLITPENGTFHLRQNHFAKPSKMTAFAVVDFTNGKSKNFMKPMLDTLVEHGVKVEVPGLNFNLDSVIAVSKEWDLTNHQGPPPIEKIRKAFETAIQYSEQTFFDLPENDYSRLFVPRLGWNHSHDTLDSGSRIILPNSMGGGVIYPNKNESSHLIKLDSQNEVVCEARMMAVVEQRQGESSKVVLDPFEVDLEKHRVVRHAFWLMVDGKNEYRVESQFHDRRCKMDVCRIPFLFIYLPDDRKDLYSACKQLAWLEFGLASQCVVHTNFSKFRNPAQYCSNIAIKVNTKLSESSLRHNNEEKAGQAWQIVEREYNQDTPKCGLPWINEIETLVLGVDVVHTKGQANAEGITVVVSTVALDSHCMRFAQSAHSHSKLPYIIPEVFQELVETCYKHFLRANNYVKPKRILYYRGGLSDGEIKTVFLQEIALMRKTIFDIKCEIKRQNNEDFSCPLPECKGRGCLFCTPPITAVVCQTNNPTRIVPSRNTGAPSRYTGCNNVPSGTVVDTDIMDIDNHWSKKATRDIPCDDSVLKQFPIEERELFLRKDENGCDFYLVAQGGLKGTSKPVKYITWLNENLRWNVSSDKCTPLTGDKLQKLTYHASYQYGTATKAVRVIPVVLYSTRLAKQLLAIVPTMRMTGLLVGKKLNDDVSRSHLREGIQFDTVKYVQRKPDGTERKTTQLLHDNFIRFDRKPYYPHVSA